MASSNVPFKSALDSFLDRRNEASDREVKYAQLIQQARIQNEQLAIQQSQERRGIVQQGQNMRLNEINMRGSIDANQRANSAQNYADAIRQMGFGNLQKQADIQGFTLGTEAKYLPMQAQALGLLRGQQLFNAEKNDAIARGDIKRLLTLTGEEHFKDALGRVYKKGIGSDGNTEFVYLNGNTQEQQQIQDNVKTATGKYTLDAINNFGNPAAGTTGAGASGAGGANNQSASPFDPTRFASPSTPQTNDAAAVAPVFNAGRGSYAGFDPNAVAPQLNVVDDMQRPTRMNGEDTNAYRARLIEWENKLKASKEAEQDLKTKQLNDSLKSNFERNPLNMNRMTSQNNFGLDEFYQQGYQG